MLFEKGARAPLQALLLPAPPLWEHSCWEGRLNSRELQKSIAVSCLVAVAAGRILYMPFCVRLN